MSTAAVSSRVIPLGVSTKGLNCDDPFAKLIQAEFIDLVDPKLLTLYLPPDLLTPSDEERVVARQDSMGRQEAARLLLALLSQRGDWIPRLMEGLQHREVRLGHLADRINDLQAHVPMEVDLDSNDQSDLSMEVDSEPSPESAELSSTMRALLAGRGLRQLDEQELTTYKRMVLMDISKHFFTHLARSVGDVKTLTDCFERITTILTTEIAIGCLELRLRIGTSRDLRELRRLVEGGILVETIERALQTKERRDWLVEKAAKYGLKWRQVRLKVNFRKDDLNRCETFLKVKEELADPRSPAEALLLKQAAKKANGEEVALGPHAPNLPKLLLSFLDWLLLERPDLAEEVASILVTSPLDIAVTETMATCRRSYGLSNEHEKDLADVVLEMVRRAEGGGWEKLAGSSRSPWTETEDEPSSPPPTSSKLYVEAPPHSPLAQTVERLREAKLMMPLHAEERGVGNTFTFSSPLVADFAFTCTAEPLKTHPWFIFIALVFGSRFVILHLLDFLLNLSLPTERLASGLRADERFGRARKRQSQMIRKILMKSAQDLLRSLSDGDHPLLAVEMYMACYRYIGLPNIAPLFKKHWVTFGPEWKALARDWLASDRPDAFPDIRLLPLSDEERMDVAETMQMVLSARHTADLTGKLTNLSKPQISVVLGCLQLTNVAKFEIANAAASVTLRAVREKQGVIAGTPATAVGQPALKLCENVLDDAVVDGLADAMPGLESVSRFDLTGCTVSFTNLQRLLDTMHASSVRSLVLNRISLSDSKAGQFPSLPRFSRLKRLQAVELGFLGLRDEQMPELAEQLRALPDLRELSLEGNPITATGLSRLTPSLASRDSLRALRLPRCQLDAGAAYVLGALLTSARNLHVLNLSQCRLEDSGLQHLSSLLTDHAQLSKVSLRGGGYSPRGLVSFLSHLARCRRMQHLEIGQCPLWEEGGSDVSDKLLEALAGSSLWDYLGLWHCRIGHTCFLERLPDTLRVQLRGLTTLVLQDNDLDDVQVGHLATAVRRGAFRCLRHLNLRENSIGKAGAECLAEVLPRLPRLTELWLQNTSIPAAAALAVAGAVLRLPDMKLLDLSDSYAMGAGEVSEVIDEIELAVREGNVVVGDGVGFAGDDAGDDAGDADDFLERQFADDKLCLLGLLDTKPGATGDEFVREGKDEGGKEEGGKDEEGGEEEETAIKVWRPAASTAEGLLFRVAAAAGPTEQKSPIPMELSPGFAEVRRRQLAERQGRGDDVLIDGVLRINLGHNAWV